MYLNVKTSIFKDKNLPPPKKMVSYYTPTSIVEKFFNPGHGAEIQL